MAVRRRETSTPSIMINDLPGNQAIAMGYFSEPLARGSWQMQIPHVYTSTACLHRKHGECRQHCKFCAAQCVCVCHQLGLY